MKKQILFCVFFIFNLIHSQQPKTPSSTYIYESLQKLNFLGSVLYIAAHPDDENTRLIAYMANHIKARTAYLSLTRGDGGQNLIGPEIRSLLGVIRTQELLAARRVDGGEQLFTRANDFGYSKHPEETLNIWNKDLVLSDVILAIRKFKPDIIINRFDHRTPGTTHGHHTSSALLSLEAFNKSNKKHIYPKQLKNNNLWQPKRLFFNTSWWFYGSKEKFNTIDKNNLVNFDIGVYYPLKGLSNNEIAAQASSKHLCQGFGRLTQRGTQKEYLEFLEGMPLKDKKNIFDGINTTWSRIKGGKAIGDILYNIERNFNFKNPSSHLNALLKAYVLIEKLEDSHWKHQKTKAIKSIIEACTGLYLEASASTNWATQNDIIDLNIEAINRSNNSVLLKNISITNGKKIDKNILLKTNIKQVFKAPIKIDKNIKPTTPYWLNSKNTLGMYKAKPEFIGLCETR